jgi:hypothetical protein
LLRLTGASALKLDQASPASPRLGPSGKTSQAVIIVMALKLKICFPLMIGSS